MTADAQGAVIRFSRCGPLLLRREAVPERAKVPSAPLAVTPARLDDHVLEEETPFRPGADLFLGDEALRGGERLLRLAFRFLGLSRFEESNRLFVELFRRLRGPLREKKPCEEQGRNQRTAPDPLRTSRASSSLPAAASRVSIFLQKAKRSFCRPSFDW